jgi:ATP/maltotriose-dependent transcriptional regulator MalT
VELSLDTGNAALEKGQWTDARAAFASALAHHPTPEALDGLAQALWWLGETRRSLDCRTRAYAGYRSAGETDRAFAAAVGIAICYVSNYGNRPAALGWVGRAERLLGGAEPGSHGWICALRGYLAEDLDSAWGWTDRALHYARKAGDVDLELTTLADRGLVLVRHGRAQEGVELLDEALAGTLAGECTRLDTVVYTGCDMLEACELTGDLGRARQWCRVADDFIQTYGSPFLYARCRTHYGALLVAVGEWARADTELAAAVRMTQDIGPAPRAEALSRLADLRVRQGRLEDAEALISRCGDQPCARLPAAAVCMFRGDPGTAIALLERLAERRHATRIERAQTLALLAEAQLAGGCIDAAAATCARLDTIADGRDDLSCAHAASARGAWHAAAGRPEPALRLLEQAHDLYIRLELPWEAARARLQIARALATPAPERAVEAARAALAACERLGAAADADRAAALLRSLGAVARVGPKRGGTLTVREQEVLRLLGSGLSNPEIAARLFISRKTAAHHVSSLLAKLGARNRTEAVAYALRLPSGTTPLQDR